MKQHLLIGFVVLVQLAMGCQQTTPAPAMTSIPGQGFVKQWQADLVSSRDPIVQLHLRENLLVAYSKGNNSFWMSSSGGQLLAVNQLASPGLGVLPPIALEQQVAIPTTASLEIFSRDGRQIQSLPSSRALESPGVGTGRSILIGVNHPGSGRLAKVDVGDHVSVAWEMYTSSGMTAAPAVVGNDVFAAGIDGRVWAVSLARQPLWTLPENYFKTDGAVTGDVAADDYGVYVASQDTKLYCLDRNTGRIKWVYHAGAPLLEGPVVLGNMIYQLVPGRGVAAVAKTEGKRNREALWVQPAAQQILSSDESFVYVRSGTAIVALDKASGEPKFRSERSDLVVFATNRESSLIYAATRGGSVLAIRPVTRPGTVGEIVLETTTLREAFASAN